MTEAVAALEAAQAAVLPRLQALLEAAAAEVCPSVAAVAHSPREAVRRTLSSDGFDFASHAPMACWLRLLATASDVCVDGACGAFRMPAGGVAVVTLGPLGALRRREYADAASLAEAWLEAAGEGGALSALCADARCATGGALRFTTRAQAAAQRAAGRLACALCGKYFSARRGLRDHSQVAHGAPYEASIEAVRAAQQALLPLPQHTPAGRGVAAAPDPLADAALASALAARVADAAAARDALPAGLAAARDGDVAALRALLAGGWDPRATADRHGSTALLWAAGGGHLEACRLLVAHGSSPKAAQKRDGRTALHWAARNGHVSVVAWLVRECGCHPDVTTKDGTTPLHWAAYCGHLPVMQWLLDEAGADCGARNAYGCNAGQWAAQAGDVAVCDWLLQRGLDWRVLNRNGHSCLHKAAVKGQAAVCAWLLATPGLGAEHMQPDGDGNTPARMAAAEGFDELAEWLTRAAADRAAVTTT
jgi:ankyrin repeat protein